MIPKVLICWLKNFGYRDYVHIISKFDLNYIDYLFKNVDLKVYIKTYTYDFVPSVSYSLQLTTRKSIATLNLTLVLFNLTN